MLASNNEEKLCVNAHTTAATWENTAASPTCNIRLQAVYLFIRWIKLPIRNLVKCLYTPYGYFPSSLLSSLLITARILRSTSYR